MSSSPPAPASRQARQRHKPPADRDTNALQRAIAHVGQDEIDRIRSNWVAIKTQRTGSNWNESNAVILRLLNSGMSERMIRAIIPVGGSKVARLRQVIRDSAPGAENGGGATMDKDANKEHGDAATVASAPSKKRVYVEVRLITSSVASYDDVQASAIGYLQEHCSIFTTEWIDMSPGRVALAESEYLQRHVDGIEITEIGEEEDAFASSSSASGVPKAEAELIVNVFKLSDEPPAEETAEDDENVSTCQQLSLPSTSLDGLWESLIYDSSVKRHVLEYAATAMLFSDSKVNPRIISWNRVVLLHGPPGTGKTSLCKALAQKLSIRLSHRYASGHLLEVNAHSLFSKWFSESGKLVMKLFRQIQELVEDQEALVCVLIDEVESLTAARKAALSGSEPSDAIRVVNALLTQLDSLKNYPNVLVLTTSNITEAIDLAFVDRADIKQYIGLPSVSARYEILRSCVEELCRVKLVHNNPAVKLLPYPELIARRVSMKRTAAEMTSDASPSASADEVVSTRLLRVAEAADGFSGRSLRKLPFQAHAFFVQTRHSDLNEYILKLGKTVEMEKAQKAMLVSG